MQGNSAELFFRATNGGNIFAKGFAGGGWLNGGSLDDEDFFAGQVKSPTLSAGSKATALPTSPSTSDTTSSSSMAPRR
jgi:hypothetical protein